MATVFDYLDWRGDLDFACAPFCEVDNLILSFLSYLDFSGLVLEGDTVGLPLERLAPLYFVHHPRRKGGLGLLIPDRLYDLLEDAAASRRFGCVRLWGHRSKLDEGRQLQFSATTFTLGSGQSFVAFRGTDDTIVGWKEDFNMAVDFPVPAQEEARAYLTFVASRTADRLLLGGHSKGGNLAVYAAAFSSPEVQRRIDAVWSNDGPGFREETLAHPGYRAIRHKVCSLLPRSSVVGVLLHSDPEPIPVESSAVGALQHDGLTWQVLGPAFVRAEELSRSSRQVEKTFHSLLEEMEPEQRRSLIDDVFSATRELGAKTLSELVADGKKRQSLKAISGALTGLEKETRDSLFRAIRAAFRDEENPEEEIV